MGTNLEQHLITLRDTIAQGADDDRRVARLEIAKIDPSDLSDDARLALAQLETHLNLTLDEHGHLLEGASPEQVLVKIEELSNALNRPEE